MRSMEIRTKALRILTFVCILPLAIVQKATAGSPAAHIRWDVLGFDAATNSVITGTTANGGTASATAYDGSTITFTGSGNFVVPASGGGSSATGAGTWTTTAGCPPGGTGTTVCPTGSPGSATQNASGTYQVTKLVRFDPTAGTLAGQGLNDGIGNIDDTHAGLATFLITYSDGSHGILVFSCSLFAAGTTPPSLTPSDVFEGVTATKGAVDFENAIFPPVGTLFHIPSK